MVFEAWQQSRMRLGNYACNCQPCVIVLARRVGPASKLLMTFFTSKLFLAAELALLMFGVPLVLWLWLPPRAIPSVVLGMAILCYIIARKVDHHYARARDADPQYARRSWNWRMINRANLKPILLRFMVCSTILGAFTYTQHREMLFGFVSERPMIWVIVMVLYPVVSVVPQEIIFRRYVFIRFGQWLQPPVVLILVSGLGFGFAHVIFDNWLAPALCAIGGLMFASTYQKTRSLALVCLEHALYGNFIFTVGLGRFFYHGAVGSVH